MDLGLGTLISGGLGAVANLFGANAGSKRSLQAVRETNEANKELAEYQYEKNLEMWNYQNEYNTPQNQMKRLIDAGLNPNLMYGQGDTGNASNAPQYDAPRMEAYTGFGDLGVSSATTQLMQGLMGYANIKKTNAEADQIRQNTQNLEVQKQLTELQIIQQGFDNAKSEEELKIWGDLYRAKIANIDSSTLNNFAHGQLADSQRFYTDSQRERFNLLTPIVEKTLQTELNQKLFDLNKLSPQKLQNLIADTRYKDIISKLSNVRAELLFNDLEFSNEQNKYVSERAINELLLQRENVEIKQLQKDLTKILREHGVKPGMSIQQAIVSLFANPWFNNN